MKQEQNNTQPQAALLRSASIVDVPVKNSLCCAAAGITALSSSTTEALIPHKKLRGAAPAEATLIAQNHPLAQPVVGYTHPVCSSASSSQVIVDTSQLDARAELEKEFPVLPLDMTEAA